MMMIKKLQTPDDVSILFNIIDDVEWQFPCDRSAWIQWLVEQIVNPKIGVWAAIEDDIVSGYLVMLDSIAPPISDSVVVLYLWSPQSHKITRLLIEEAKKWTQEIGAKRGLITVPESHNEKYIKSFGGKKIASVFEWRIE